MNETLKKVYKYDNRVQAVCKPFVVTAIKVEAEQTGQSESSIAARILENHYNAQKTQGRQSKNTY